MQTSPASSTSDPSAAAAAEESGRQPTTTSEAVHCLANFVHSPCLPACLLACLLACLHTSRPVDGEAHTPCEPHRALLYNAGSRTTTTPTHTHSSSRDARQRTGIYTRTHIQNFKPLFWCVGIFSFSDQAMVALWQIKKRERERKLMITRKRLNLRHFLVNCERMSLLHAVPTGFWTFFWVGEDCQPCVCCACAEFC